MIVRRGPAIVLSLALSAAALSGAPALAVDGGAAKVVDRDPCENQSTVRIRIVQTEGNTDRFDVIASVYSDDDDYWSWKLRHNGDLSAQGEVKARDDIDRSFRVTRTMLDFPGADTVAFRAENERTGEVCKISNDY